MFSLKYFCAVQKFKKGFMQTFGKGLPKPIFRQPWQEVYTLLKKRYGGWYTVDSDAEIDVKILGRTAARSFNGDRVYAENYREGDATGCGFIEWDKSAKDARLVPLFIFPIIKINVGPLMPVTVGWKAWCAEIKEDKQDDTCN